MTEAVRAACVMGWPVSQSRSPLIHGYWLKQHGLKGEYRREAITPDDFPDFLADLADRGYVGGNVTMPHKDMALKLSRAGRAGTGGRRRQHAVARPRHAALDQHRRRRLHRRAGPIGARLGQGLEQAVVIGAGGAARAVVYGLVERKVPEICVVNRTLAKAEALRGRFGPTVTPLPWDESAGRLSGAGPSRQQHVARHGRPPRSRGGPGRALSKNGVVADVVYVPLETSLLKAARAAACAPRTASACCCIRPGAASSCGSASGPR